MIGAVIEILIVVLLVVTCGYCFVLNNRLSMLRKGQTELVEMISKFDEASKHAERNLAVMKANGATAGREIETMTERAKSLVDELSVMVSAGDNIALRIEGVVNEVRTIGASRKNTARRLS